MTESPRRDGPQQSPPYGDSYQGYDPAYASQASYGPVYQPPAGPAPTQRLPYPPYGYDPYATGQYSQYTGQYPPQEPPPPPEEPKTPMWLWAIASVAVLSVIALVIALVIVNSSQQQTVVAPAPTVPEPTTTTPPRTTTPRATPTVPVIPLPTVPRSPTTRPTPTTPSGATQTVIYDVSGQGRAINITYVDTGGLLQTEFNVLLPWRKEVELPSPARTSASISIINVGREVNCSISIDGVLVQENTGAGLTICTALN